MRTPLTQSIFSGIPRLRTSGVIVSGCEASACTCSLRRLVVVIGVFSSSGGAKYTALGYITGYEAR